MNEEELRIMFYLKSNISRYECNVFSFHVICDVIGHMQAYIQGFDLVFFTRWSLIFRQRHSATLRAEQPDILARNLKCAVPGAPPKGGIHGNPTSFLNHLSFWLLFLWRSNSSILRPSWLVKFLTLFCRLRPATQWKNIMSPMVYLWRSQSKNLDQRWGSEKDCPVNRENCSVIHRPCSQLNHSFKMVSELLLWS